MGRRPAARGALSPRGLRVAIWTEAGHRRGMGDLMSSLAIARALRAHGIRTVVAVNGGTYLRRLPDRLRARLTIVRSVSSPAELRRSLGVLRPHVLVLNKMNNSPALIAAARAGARRVVSIDDRGPAARRIGHRIYPFYAPRGFRGARGARFVALWQRPARAASPAVDACDRILVAQGGADTSGLTPRIVQALGALSPHAWLDVVVGAAFKHEAALRRAVRRCAGRVRVHRNPPRLPALMRAAKLAVTAGGLMMFELAYLGVPCVVVTNERFETATAGDLARQGAVVSLGYGGDLTSTVIAGAVELLRRDPARRRRLSLRARAVVDGEGAERIADLIVRWGAA